jgi:pimeloyl-ACP methyl ester carboxylesterase
MRTDDVTEAGRLAGVGVAAAVGLVRDTHLALARRAFTLSGPGGGPAHVAHDAISSGVYAAVGGGARVAASAAGVVAAMRARRAPAYRRITDRPRGNVVVGAVNGAWGDRLERWGSPLALGMTVRRFDCDVPVTADSLARTYADATGDVVVFLHGLCETEAAWRLGAVGHWGAAGSTHGSRLRQACGATPVYLRYNTGRHVCDNGADLSDLLARLVAAWPVPLTRLTLVGHSMGGLVIRAACAAGGDERPEWLGLAQRVVFLGSPHLGAPLEVAADRATRALRRLPETRALGDALASRSVGIKDLRFGAVRRDDWGAAVDFDVPCDEPEDCAPLLETAEHYYVGATLGRRTDTVAARVLGDALVPWSSASGAGPRRRLALDVDRGRHLAGLHHFDLLNHPRVYAVLEEWLAG